MTLEMWIGLAALNFLASLSPGQNVALVGGTVLRSGTRSGVAAVLGILLAEAVWAILALCAVIGVLQLDGTLMFGLQLAGGVLLILFGLSILAARIVCTAPEAAPEIALDKRMIGKGACIGFANPLALVFFLSVFPQFVTVDDTGLSAFSVIFCVSAIVLSAALALAPYFALAAMLARSAVSNMLQRVSGAMLVGFGLLVLAEGMA